MSEKDKLSPFFGLHIAMPQNSLTVNNYRRTVILEEHMGLKILEIDALSLIRPIFERLYCVTTRHNERVPQPH